MRVVKESIKILGLHIVVGLVAMILSYPFWFLVQYPHIYSGIFTLVYIAVIYSAGWDMGKRDSRRVEEFHPSMKRAILVGLCTQIIAVVLFVFRVICPFVFERVWEASGAGFELKLVDHPVTIIADLLYKLWFYPFSGFMGKGDFIGYLIPLFVIPLAVVAGYHFGLKKIAWFDKIYSKILYKK